ncbi:hypothetical protein J2T07_001605 [Luteibacter jiangsuensis]|uniref:DUF4279 domain-containing protein n=1 Tax=Luteibacter jiangsuensis TaxID=637577 RepID=A0ABT9SYP4_9GAMM|nr:DUF4279 domain-containing protein [Luteibacter jiangsuensis]MDQ0009428.1 hypothetical protein [Luteibacter jiangsuensis]
MSSKLFISFSLIGTTTHPRDISAVTRIKPYTELLRGERNSERDLPRSNLWTLRSEGGPEQSVESHWNTIEKDLLSNIDAFRRFSAEGRAVITIVVMGDDPRCPSIEIPPSMSLFAGSIGATIDVDHLQ